MTMLHLNQLAVLAYDYTRKGLSDLTMVVRTVDVDD